MKKNVIIPAALCLALTLACAKEKEAALWDCDNIAAMNKESQFLLLQGIGCGALFASSDPAAGGSEVAVPVEEATGGAEISTVGAGEFTVILPDTDFVGGEAPEGEFTGMTFYGENTDVAGFVGVLPGGGATASEMNGSTTANLLALPEIAGVSIIASQSVNEETVVVQYQIETVDTMTATELNNLLIENLGNQGSEDLESMAENRPGESSATDFRAVAQFSSTAGSEGLIGIGVVPASGYAEAEAQLTGFLDGTNVAPAGTEVLTGASSFDVAGAAVANFLWVIDNSGSMREEQDSVIANAEQFFDRMVLTGMKFSIGVITTDSSELQNTGFTDQKNEFKAAVAGTGLKGHYLESGVFYAEQALLPGGSVANADVISEDSSMTVVFLSDEGDHYSCFTGGQRNRGTPACVGGTPFNQADNVFLTLNIKAYSIIGLDPATGEAGRCGVDAASGAPKAKNVNNADPNYHALAQNTGGASASICATDYSAVLENIATQTAAAASDYVLDVVPVSSTLRVAVNGAQVERSMENGFSYNSASNSLIFTGSAVPLPGSKIDVQYNYIPVATAALAAWIGGNAGWIMLLLLTGFGIIGLLLTSRFRSARS